MRSSKRVLAGVAAGALGAGMLVAITAAPAQAAGTAAALELASPSYTLNVTGVSSSVRAVDDSLPIIFSVVDSDGAATTTMTNRRIDYSITAPATAKYTGTSSAVKLIQGTTRTTAGTDTTATAAANLGLVASNTAGTSSMAWEQLATDDSGATGTYTINITLVNTTNGAALSTVSMPVAVVTEAGKPSGVMAYVNGSGNLINALGSTQGAGVAPQTLVLANAAGGAYLDDTGPAMTATGASSTSAFGDGAIYGWSTTAANMRVYGVGTYNKTAPSGAVWNAVSAGTLNSAFGSGTSTLPVYLSTLNNLTSSTKPSVELTTTPSSSTAGYTNGADIAVPPGTTSLSFGVTTPTTYTTAQTVAWNASSTAGATGITNASGGVSTVSLNSGTINLTASAAAASVDETVTVVVGDDSSSETTTYTVAFVAPAAEVSTLAPIAKVGTEATIAGTILSQYGAVLPGTWAISLKAGADATFGSTSIATAIAAADGSFTIKVPAAYAATTPGTETFTVWASNGLETDPANSTVQYTSTGGVTSLAVAASGKNSALLDPTKQAVVNLPSLGVVSLGASSLTSSVASAGATVSQTTVDDSANTAAAFVLTAAVSPTVPVTFTTTEGALLSTSTSGTIPVSSGKLAVTPTSSTAVSVFATKPGTYTVTASAGETKATYTFRAFVASYSGRTIESDAAVYDVKPNNFISVSATVKDIFGNKVPGATVNGALAGGGTLSGGSGTATSQTTTTAGASAAAVGKAELYYTAPLGDGNARLIWSFTPQTTATLAGYPDAVDASAAEIRVGTAPSEKTIVIVGERGTVSGKPGILVDGKTTGFAKGDTVKPWVKFPGQTSYEAGSARPEVTAVGDFSWQRKTGKKTYVYFSSLDDVTKSNRVIIAAN